MKKQFFPFCTSSVRSSSFCAHIEKRVDLSDVNLVNLWSYHSMAPRNIARPHCPTAFVSVLLQLYYCFRACVCASMLWLCGCARARSFVVVHVRTREYVTRFLFCNFCNFYAVERATDLSAGTPRSPIFYSFPPFYSLPMMISTSNSYPWPNKLCGLFCTSG